MATPPKDFSNSGENVNAIIPDNHLFVSKVFLPNQSPEGTSC